VSIILDSSGRPFSGTSPAVSRRRALKARYDAASTPEDMRKWWGNADALSADAANSLAVRAKIRNRARYEVSNNSWLKGIVLTLANYLVGRGPRLQMLLGEGGINDLIEKEFARWARHIRLAAKLRTLVQARVVDGEAFALLVTNPMVPSRVKLDLRPIECDQITSPGLAVLQPGAIDGIRFDPYDNPVEYDLLDQHPGSGLLTRFQPRPIAAEYMIHWFRADRPGQHRGVSELTPSLMLYAMLRRYGLAAVQAAELQAEFSAILEGAAANEGEESGDAGEPFDLLEIVRGMLMTTPTGTKLSQLQPTHPTDNHETFTRTTMNEAARCVNMPLNVATCNSSQYNYASDRLDHQVFFKSIDVDADDLSLTILDRIFNAWVAEARLSWDELRDSEALMLDEPPHAWFFEGREHVDPVKEATSRQIDLACGMTSYPTEFARMGLDYEQEMKKQARALGLDLDEYRRLLREKLFAVKGGERDAARPDEDEDEVAQRSEKE